MKDCADEKPDSGFKKKKW